MMNITDALRVLITSVDLHLNKVVEENPTDDEFNAYFAPDGWGTAQSEAVKVAQIYLKKKGGSRIL
jgi:hypothetical protein